LRPRSRGFAFEDFPVADEKRDAPRPFDVQTVEYLLKLMTDHDLFEVDLKEGDQRIRLRKGGAIPAAFAPPNPGNQSAAPPNPANHAAAAPVTTTPPPTPTPARNLVEIKSPMVGTYYSKPKPDKPEYVTVGSIVNAKTVVCLLEAMKLYNEILAEVSGTIAEV